eukprot:860267-Rhodomonas_salina.2
MLATNPHQIVDQTGATPNALTDRHTRPHPTPQTSQRTMQRRRGKSSGKKELTMSSGRCGG